MCRKGRLGARVSEREAWSACVRKGGLECVPEMRLGVHVSERDAWSARAGKGGL